MLRHVVGECLDELFIVAIFQNETAALSVEVVGNPLLDKGILLGFLEKIEVVLTVGVVLASDQIAGTKSRILAAVAIHGSLTALVGFIPIWPVLVELAALGHKDKLAQVF